jgi:tetratricopeptide (TPR) repeat protein
MTRLPHAAALWAANLLVPGAGLVMLGRVVSGVVIGVLWGAMLAAVLLTGLVWRDPGRAHVLLYFLASAAALYAGAQVVLYARKRVLGNHLAGEARDTQFKAALVAYLAGRLDESEKTCKALLAIDPDDVEATLQLATIARRCGKAALARRLLARTRYLDDEGRWAFEIERELAALAEAPPPVVQVVTLTPHGPQVP